MQPMKGESSARIPLQERFQKGTGDFYIPVETPQLCYGAHDSRKGNGYLTQEQKDK